MLVSSTNVQVYKNSVLLYYTDSAVTLLAVQFKWVDVYLPRIISECKRVLYVPIYNLVSLQIPRKFWRSDDKTCHWWLNTAVFLRSVKAKASKHIIIWKKIGRLRFARGTNFTTW
jgi:hypothetical protein